MQILIAGGNGYIGRALTKALVKQGHSVRWLIRSIKNNAPVPTYYWDPETQKIDLYAFDSVRLVIQCIGAPVNNFWSQEYKEQIYQSRVNASQFLYNTIVKHAPSVQEIIHFSAIGYYGSAPKQACIESTLFGDDFLARVCHDWESTISVFSKSIRISVFRLGVVIGPESPFVKSIQQLLQLPIQLLPQGGNQLISWISEDDVVASVMHILQNQPASATYNLTSPHPLTFRQLLHLSKPRMPILSAPEWLFKWILGERYSFLFSSQQVVPQQLMASGFQFIHPHFTPDLIHG